MPPQLVYYNIVMGNRSKVLTKKGMASLSKDILNCRDDVKDIDLSRIILQQKKEKRLRSARRA